MSRARAISGRIKQFAGLAGAALVMSSLVIVGISDSAGASVTRNETTTFTYTVGTSSAVNFYLAADINQTTPYGQTAVITFNPCDGSFSGTGTAYPNNTATPTTISGWATGADTFTFTDSYTVGSQTDYMVTANITVNDDGSFSGTWSDNYAGGQQTGTVDAGAPVMTGSSSWANHGQYVSSNGGGADAAHSCLGMPMQA